MTSTSNEVKANSEGLDASLVDEADKVDTRMDAIAANLGSRAGFGWHNILQSAISRATLAAQAERRRGLPVQASIRKRLIMTQEELMAKAYPKISIESLYSRYSQVYLLAIDDVLKILLDSTDLEDAHEKITAHIKRFGGAYKHKINAHHSKIRTKVGED